MLKRYLTRLKNKYCNLKTVDFVVTVLFFVFFLILVLVDEPKMIIVNIYILLFILRQIIEGMLREARNIELSVPQTKVRFTKKLEDGRIVIEQNRYSEAILYLYELEEKLHN